MQTSVGKTPSPGVYSPLEFLFAGLTAWPNGPFFGLHGALGPLLLGRLAADSRVTLLLTSDEDRARQLHDEARLWLGRHQARAVLFLPDRRSVYDPTPVASEIALARVAALSLAASGGGIVIAPVRCALERFFQPKRRSGHSLKLQAGASCDRKYLLELLAELGFERVNLVTEPGQFAVRGSLIDLFPADQEFPVRLDFFGDDLDSIKIFSPETQRTIDALKEFALRPSREQMVTRADIAEILARVDEARLQLDPMRSELLQRRAEHLQTHPDSRDLQELRPFLQPGEGYLWDHWPNPRLLLEQPDQCLEVLDNAWQEIQQIHLNNADVTPLLAPEAYYHPAFAVRDELARLEAQAFSRFQGALSQGCRFHAEPVPAPSL
ncbi:MAG TPA: hypothetical protein PKO06_10160, partial [Candidatus Ozemobacteraceae bacterium]|nr:hypothetical protein [Candidatus Ozemobacteraceae bacterium]